MPKWKRLSLNSLMIQGIKGEEKFKRQMQEEAEKNEMLDIFLGANNRSCLSSDNLGYCEKIMKE